MHQLARARRYLTWRIETTCYEQSYEMFFWLLDHSAKLQLVFQQADGLKATDIIKNHEVKSGGRDSLVTAIATSAK
jgi:hypothetical protein